MARGKAISVKIATPKVIKALESALTKLEIDYKEQEANEAKFEKQMEKWRKEVKAYVIANINKATELRTNYRSWANSVNVDFNLDVAKEADFPKQPEREFVTMHSHQYSEKHNELSNAIRILKMTDEETVNTSTYNAVAQYL